MPEPVAEYFRMGGYAFYVWCSYAVVLVVLALNLAAPALRLRRVRLDPRPASPLHGGPGSRAGWR